MGLTLLSFLLLVLASAFPQGTARNFATVRGDTLSCSLHPKQLPAVQRAVVHRVSSQGVSASATLQSTRSGLFVSATAGGDFPAQGSPALQRFDPLMRSRNAYVSLLESKDGKSFSHALDFDGRWFSQPSGSGFLYRGRANTTPDLRLRLAQAPQSFALMLTIPPWPRLADFVYVSTGRCKKRVLQQ